MDERGDLLVAALAKRGTANNITTGHVIRAWLAPPRVETQIVLTARWLQLARFTKCANYFRHGGYASI